MNLIKPITASLRTYFRIQSFIVMLRPPYLLLLASLALILIAGKSYAQGCAQAASNQLCADSAIPTDQLITTPFAFGCISAATTYFYTFHTNSVADIYSASITVAPTDCDNPLGPDLIEVMVVQIPNGGDPCDQSTYTNPICDSDFETFTMNVSSLLPDQDYVVIVGSDHDIAYGPCSYTIDLAGDAVDIVAGANPSFITLGESSQLSVTGADPAAGVTWSNGDILDDPNSTTPTAYPEDEITLTVTGEVGGCIVTDGVTIEVGPPVIIYNTFTPNGDNINDVWTITGIQLFPNCQINVFDRWGQNVYKNTGYAKPWDGTYKGNYLPTAAYFYTIELNSLDVNIPPLTGTVSIVH